MPDVFSLVSLIILNTNNRLVDVLQTEIDASDVTRAGVVRPGLLQADPTKNGGINVLTFPNDPDNYGEWRHSRSSEGTNLGQENVPSWQVGIGGNFWYRRFTTKLDQFLPATIKDRVEAEQISHLVLSRAESAIEQVVPDFGPDNFGEYPIQFMVVDSFNDASGAPGKFIWHSVIRWMVLTEKTR